jgi:hypothetical protein
MRQLTLTIDLPPEATGEELTEQFRWVIKTCRDALQEYKDRGIQIPVLSIKGVKPAGTAPKAIEYKEFSNELLDFHLKYMPNADVAAQRAAIRKLYETGMSKQELIDLYVKSQAEYKMTTWFTIIHILGKNKSAEPEQVEFVRTELDADATESLKQRLKTGYGLHLESSN